MGRVYSLVKAALCAQSRRTIGPMFEPVKRKALPPHAMPYHGTHAGLFVRPVRSLTPFPPPHPPKGASDPQPQRATPAPSPHLIFRAPSGSPLFCSVGLYAHYHWRCPLCLVVCGLYIRIMRQTPVRGLRKGSGIFGLLFKASMVGFPSHSRALTTISARRRKVPPPPSRPTTVRQGNGGL